MLTTLTSAHSIYQCEVPLRAETIKASRVKISYLHFRVQINRILDKSERPSVSFPKAVGSPSFRLLSEITEPKPACDGQPCWRWFWKYHSSWFMFISISAQIEGQNNSHTAGIICGIYSSQDLERRKKLTGRAVHNWDLLRACKHFIQKLIQLPN